MVLDHELARSSRSARRAGPHAARQLVRRSPSTTRSRSNASSAGRGSASASTTTSRAPGSYFATDGRRGAGARRARRRRHAARVPQRLPPPRLTARRPTAASARALQCPYHGWVYRLDGSLARAAGVGEPEGFDPACSGLFEVRVTTFARSLFVNVDPDAADFDPGPLGRGRRAVPPRPVGARPPRPLTSARATGR